MEKIFAYDEKISQWIQKNCRRSWLDKPMQMVTHLGDLGFIWLIWAAWLFRDNRVESVLLFGSIACCCIICNLIMKPLFARERPFEDEDVELLIAEPTDHSFPSGHTMASFTAASALMWMFGGWIGAFALILAILIGWSRLYLYVHHPSDVAAGALFGSILGSLCVNLGGELAVKLAEFTVFMLGM